MNTITKWLDVPLDEPFLELQRQLEREAGILVCYLPPEELHELLTTRNAWFERLGEPYDGYVGMTKYGIVELRFRLPKKETTT